MAPDGREVTPVTEGMETIAQPFWSPDGTRMVVACCASGPGTLFLLDGPGAEPIELAPGVEEATSPAWSPDGSRIAFESVSTGSLFVVDVAGASAVRAGRARARRRPVVVAGRLAHRVLRGGGRQHRHLLGVERRLGRDAAHRRPGARLLAALVARRRADRVRLRTRRGPGHRGDGRRRQRPDRRERRPRRRRRAGVVAGRRLDRVRRLPARRRPVHDRAGRRRDLRRDARTGATRWT